ncbi:hypothetical protein L1987_74294 [Smallanthus sonchifolius]|uniref:Uncharacterized protein n=1 Tax=Smallanthus sonchifolius TaxID=185202 RepID=A0ACB9A2Y6_9ASTR|nr:hypothetical protein L1987_74294 [Smallanthus sonchifolius]
MRTHKTISLYQTLEKLRHYTLPETQACTRPEVFAKHWQSYGIKRLLRHRRAHKTCSLSQTLAKLRHYTPPETQARTRPESFAKHLQRYGITRRLRHRRAPKTCVWQSYGITRLMRHRRDHKTQSLCQTLAKLWHYTPLETQERAPDLHSLPNIGNATALHAS